ncbi:uncharacterized protein LOC132934334 isoform X2 [Metopolophium dirhodum]|nr:uncharacterized protein LOC132934334 isoform X2 [Metopolophium dirhodum]
MSATKLTELVNDAEMRLTNDGKDFILGIYTMVAIELRTSEYNKCVNNYIIGYGYYEDRIVVLGTIEFLRKLCSTDTVFMSSYNIKLESQLFRHLYTLHCFVDEKLVPMVYALLFNNNKRAYLRMFQIIKDTSHINNLKFNPSNFYIDVDLNIIPTIEEMFGLHKTIIKLSLYYYANIIWHKVISLGLSHNDDYNIEKTIRRMCYLALIPLEHIGEIWTKIKNEAPQNENLLELISYITDTFIIYNGRVLNTAVWNHYDTDNIKSISYLDGFSDFIDANIKNSNLSAIDCIIKLKNMQQDFEMEILTPKKSKVVSKIPKKYKFLEAKFNHAKEK